MTTSRHLVGDPLDEIVELVCGVERHLAGDEVRQVVARTVRGPVTRRRVAQELRSNPRVLTTGQYPSVWSVGLLLAALRKAGAHEVSAPRCCGCGKELRTLFSRRGGYWGCHSCLHPPELCTACGRMQVSKRDRQGRPLCQKCPDEDGTETELVGLVARLEPPLTAEAVEQVLIHVAVRPVVRRRMARAVLERPGLLTGEGAEAPEPLVLRFIELLITAGATTVALPPCPRCGEERALTQKLDGTRVCQPCYQSTRSQPCSRCGTERPLTWRDDAGLLVCAHCRRRDPVVRERCSRCGKLRPIAHRSEADQLCQHCRPVRHGTCSLCGLHKTIEISQATGLPWCAACAGRWMRCSSCSTVAPVRAGTLARPVCARCHNPDPAFWRSCGRCGSGWQLTTAACQRCRLDLHLADLLAGSEEQIRPDLLTLRTALLGVERPDSALTWIRRPDVLAVITRLRDESGPIGHSILDALPPSAPSRTCAASWSPLAPCRTATSGCSHWSAWSARPSTRAPTPSNAESCTATRTGGCCNGSGNVSSPERTSPASSTGTSSRTSRRPWPS
ncbi:hypothetical protein ABZ208_19535 [Streptomyces sp. NPDC006208]|uniref:hypothetical protein n=1 Tax=Streptomyces sp. NPDC006208 TaxID=3156734 RepID=UPI0033A6721D